MNTYKMLDIKGKGRVELDSFIEFWQQFIQMYSIACSTKIKFTEEMRRTFEQEFILATDDRDGQMTYEDFKKTKAKYPGYLSFIDDMEDGTFDGSLANEEIKIDVDEFKAYHMVVQNILDQV
jgi:hypothetical protein